jgi:hypothetical protein
MPGGRAVLKEALSQSIPDFSAPAIQKGVDSDGSNTISRLSG